MPLGYIRLNGHLVRNGERRGWPVQPILQDVFAPSMPEDEDGEEANTPPRLDDDTFRDLFDIATRGRGNV